MAEIFGSDGGAIAETIRIAQAKAELSHVALVWLSMLGFGKE
jgi:hypothetical protein